MDYFVNVERLTFTGSGDASLVGNSGNNVITGGVGADTLYGGAGDDRLIGGEGTDTAAYSYAVTINLKTGVHKGEAAGDTFESIEVIQGSQYADTFAGTAGADTFNAGTGKYNNSEYIDIIDYSTSSSAVSVDLTTQIVSGGDAEGDRLTGFERVVGSDFADTLSSSTYLHVLEGGTGDDVYVVGNNGITVMESANGGDDEIRTTLRNYSMERIANVERLTFTGSGDASLVGNSGNNVITGGVGADTLYGGAGDDRLIGGDGTDTAVFTGKRGDYDISYNSLTQAYTVKDLRSRSPEGSDRIMEVERFQFADDVLSREALKPREENRAPTDILVTGGTVAENSPAGTVVATLVSIDADPGDTATFALVSGETGSFELVGKEIRVKAAADIDYEVARSHELVVAVTDAAGATLIKTITIMVSDEADGGIAGTAGSDTFLGRAEANIYYGGDGIDVVSYRDSDSAITINLTTNIHTGDAAGDIFKSIEVIEGTRFGDAFIGNSGANTFIGGYGVDTVSYASASTAVNINLATGVHTGDATGDIFESIEVIVGSSHDDTFIGDAGANIFHGGDGIDTVSYAGASAAVSIDLTSGVNGGGAENDLLIAIEHVTGSDFDDRLSSATAGHVLAGGRGNDIYVLGDINVQIIEGEDEGIDLVETALSGVTLGARLERLTYTGRDAFIGTGNDLDNVLIGGAGNDTLIGLGGADYFVGGAGADRFIGGDGIDIVSYASASTAVTINLATGVHTGEAVDDSFESIEVIVGSAHDDTFIGDAGANIFHGGDGIDTVSYAGASAAVSIDLTSGINCGGAEKDLLIAIEHVIGSDFDDRLSSATEGHLLEGGLGDDVYIVERSAVRVIEVSGAGIDRVETALDIYALSAGLENLTYTGSGAFIGAGNNLDNVLIGGRGNDMLIGGGGADRLIGGDGIDAVSYASSSTGVNINLATGAHTGDAAGDSFESIEAIVGSEHDDTFIGDAGANTFIGGAGVDTVSYAESHIGIMVNLTTGVHAGGAEGDVFRSVEVIRGSSANDFFIGDADANVFHGGAGTDTVVFRGKRSDYSLTFDGVTQTYMLSDRRSGSPDGNDKVSGVELFQFADRTLTLEALLGSQNTPPTDILVKGGTIAENSRAGTVVATLAGIDPDMDDTMSFSLVAGATDRFELVGNTIRVKTSSMLDYETQSEHELGIMVTDAGGATFTKNITIAVSDVANEGVREGTAKKDVIYGKAGDGVIYGYAGNDVLVAGVNGTTLSGGNGDDIVSGNCADDRIIGGQGDDMLSGLEGRDAFVFSANEGNDVIYDFNVAEDIIEIQGIPLATSFEQIMANISEADNQITINFGDSNGVSLDGVSKWQLTTDNFIFA
ncbi:Hemolysin-type calcium-binding region (fragment) [Agrobacterium sp. NCPPB 925]